MPRAARPEPAAQRGATPLESRLKVSKAGDAAAKNKPLIDDIRLLGRILGDVIREQEGK